MPPSPQGAVVLGLGNPVLSDDAVGLHVAAALSRLLDVEPIPGVCVETSTRAGFELLDLLSPYSRAVLVDCLDIPDAEPGRVRKLSLQDFAGSARLVNQHEVSVAAAFALAQRLGVPMPQQVEIYAVEAADVRTLCELLTPAVAAAVEPLACMLYAQLRQFADAQHEDTNPPQLKRSFYDPHG